ncbi:lipopolysaccharide assembly protein LapA domain-containing protein [Desulforhabdus sp. TSK]|uniref:lipopolysaccharide assembly protein LapA domain-containing protein n=1 Tax=Desulforhabdus sp. TSK TaxID=2925014 RepID=UPI001FC80E82|nr:lipopolysaccharide assembly protein LapA domain-containing protein [Desulforhabdus sp. TSK]GKT10130.1 hypothetical protein DSTSK_34350 [Desulforhabdus sp. TSK]
MKIFKLILTLLILGFATLFAWENLSTFQQVIPFQLNLYFREVQKWEHHIYTVLGIAFGLGFFLGAVLVLRPYFRLRRRLVQERVEREQMRASQEAARVEKPNPIPPPVVEIQPEPAAASPSAPENPASDSGSAEAPPAKPTQG